MLEECRTPQRCHNGNVEPVKVKKWFEVRRLSREALLSTID